jgi:hypothetical protein
LNFILHRSLRPLAGVDFTKYFPSEDGSVVWEAWQRAAMGLRSSPYQAVQGVAYAEEEVRGDRKQSTNVFRWDRVILNLPGSEDYNPARPWVFKVRDDDGSIAADVHGFMDDFRTSGKDKKDAWLSARRMGSVSSHLGLQEAARKRRESTQRPGAWIGSVLRAGSLGVFAIVTEGKWDKVKAHFAELLEMINTGPEKMNRLRMEQIRGFVNYVSMTYTWMKPNMIGVHLTIDGFRPGRDEAGWRVNRHQMIMSEEDMEMWIEMNLDVPLTVKAVPRLKRDIEALLELCSSDKPPLKRIRCSGWARAYYGFMDAAKPSFGASVQIDDRIHYEYGQWSSEVSERTSSNWKELANLV